jgi:hypothetical protein
LEDVKRTAGKLAGYKIPKAIELVDAIPRNRDWQSDQAQLRDPSQRAVSTMSNVRARASGLTTIDLCVITCRAHGRAGKPRPMPRHPYTPAEIGEEARRAYEAAAEYTSTRATTTDRRRFRLHLRAHQGGGAQAQPDHLELLDRNHRRRRVRAMRLHPREHAGDRCAERGHDELREVFGKRKDFVFDMVFPNTYAKIRSCSR